MIYKKYMKKRNITFDALADKTYLNKRTLERIVAGENIPDLSSIAILVYALNIPKKEIVKYIKGLTKVISK